MHVELACSWIHRQALLPALENNRLGSKLKNKRRLLPDDSSFKLRQVCLFSLIRAGHYKTSRASATFGLPLGRPERLTSLLDNSSSALSISISAGLTFCPLVYIIVNYQRWSLFDKFWQNDILVSSNILLINSYLKKPKQTESSEPYPSRERWLGVQTRNQFPFKVVSYEKRQCIFILLSKKKRGKINHDV